METTMLETLVIAAAVNAALTDVPRPLEFVPIETIAFGSCAREERGQPVWDTIRAHQPDIFLFIGDNVYADIPSIPTRADQIARTYETLGRKDEWQRFAAKIPILATWDDHDFGKNDAGVEWELKEESQQIFLDFFGVSSDDSRRDREGVYHAEVHGPPGKRVQFIMLDTRYHRDGLEKAPARASGRGPYIPSLDETKTILGDEQWEWLEDQLRVAADLRIIASSIQIVSWEHAYETWGNMPHERERLYRLIDETDASGVVLVSGDRHLMEISCDRRGSTPYPMWDFTSSGLTESERQVDDPNSHRVGPVYRGLNFGLIHIDWNTPHGVEITLEGRGGKGGDEVLMSQLLWLDDLREK